MQKLARYHQNNLQKPIKILFLSFTPAYAGGNPLRLGTLGQYGRLDIDNIKFLSQKKFLSKSNSIMIMNNSILPTRYFLNVC